MFADQFTEQLWLDYLHITPQARQITRALEKRNIPLIHDHLAFRTFDISPININMLEQHIFNMGYEHHTSYSYQNSLFNAWCYKPAEEDLPWIFFSELNTSHLTSEAQMLIHRMILEIPLEIVKRPQVFWSGRLWSMPTWQEYEVLARSCKYAAWLSVMGVRASHFSLNLNKLQQHYTLDEMIKIAEKTGLHLNLSQEKSLRAKQDYILQAATPADKMSMRFSDGSEHLVPGCYYEFVLRYEDQPGHLFEGFTREYNRLPEHFLGRA